MPLDSLSLPQAAPQLAIRHYLSRVFHAFIYMYLWKCRFSIFAVCMKVACHFYCSVTGFLTEQCNSCTILVFLFIVWARYIINTFQKSTLLLNRGHSFSRMLLCAAIMSGCTGHSQTSYLLLQPRGPLLDLRPLFLQGLAVLASGAQLPAPHALVTSVSPLCRPRTRKQVPWPLPRSSRPRVRRSWRTTSWRSRSWPPVTTPTS